MAGLITELTVAARRFMLVRQQRRAGLIDSAPNGLRFRKNMQALLDRAENPAIADYRWLEFAANEPPWIDTGISLNTGDHASWFICGRSYAAKALDIWVPPAVQVWFRVGDGELGSATRDSHSTIAEQPGHIQFGNYFPNDWADKKGGRKESDKVYRSLNGSHTALIIRWHGDALSGLKQLREHGDVDHWLSGEIERLERGDSTPPGWTSLWHVPRNEIFSACETPDQQAAICCHTHGDGGILQHEVELDLTPDTRIDWRWLVKSLPSDIREDALISHDYMSIAVEFDNGKDITYYWSADLAADTGYICPLPAWKAREYHVVIRSGSEGLGEWQEESRHLYQDYQDHMKHSMGGDFPQRIVRVWLIANSVFQRGHGDCQYAGIQLSNEKSTIQVL